MALDEKALAILIAKDEIRDLAMLYSRGVDRKDGALLRTLYTKDATDEHDVSFNGPAEDYIQFLERSFPYMPFSGHHICNHLISVDGDEGEGEVSALAFHAIPDRAGGFVEDFMCVRYIDHYRKEDGRWRFAKRVVSYDYRVQRPLEKVDMHAHAAGADPTYEILRSRLFARGPRA